MSRYNDYRSSTGILEGPRFDTDRYPRERHEPPFPPVHERPHRADAERFEARLRDIDRYGSPARRPGLYYDDDHLVRPAPMGYDRPRGVSPPPRPRLLRRQSSLDTFDRIPSRKLDEYYYRGGPPPRPAPAPMPPRRRDSPPRSFHPDHYYGEEISIADPDFYGDEEFRGFRERDPYAPRPRRSSNRVHDKPYPRKGKTRFPKHLVHPRAIIDKGYPFEERDKDVMILLALSKDQIDDLVAISRDIRRRSEMRVTRTSPSPVRQIMEHLSVATHSPRSSGGALLIERSPTRHRSHSRSHSRHHHHHSTSALSPNRSVSTNGHRRRRSSPGRASNRDESDKLNTGPLAIMVRPHNSDEDFRLERHSGGELVRHPDYWEDDAEEVTEVKRDRKSPNSRILRAMMATLT